MSRILITGADGYIGSNLRVLLESKGYDVYSLTLEDSKKERFFKVDITDRDKIAQIIKDITPDCIIHTASISSLSECEKNNDLAWKVNVEGTKNLIKAINEVNSSIKLIFISSDYVFSGEKGNYKETDELDPKTYYGKTKAESEKDIKGKLSNYIICRTANVYGRGGNFFNFVRDSLTKEKLIDVYTDTYYTPTYIDYFIDSIHRLIEMDFKGTIHLAGKERISRYDFAVLMAQVLNKSESLLIKSAQPKDGLISRDSALNTDLVQKLLSNFCPTIVKSLQYCFNNILSPYFYFKDERGQMIGLVQDMSFEEINYVESKKDSVRGNHYHKDTQEAFFIISGKIRVELTEVKNRTFSSFVVENDDFFVIKPSTVHTFYVLEDSKWINMLSKSMKNGNKDIFKLEN